MEREWITAQIGARQHYAVPRMAHRRGRLHHLYTDAWLGQGQSLLRRIPDPVRSLANRHHPELPTSKVTAFTAHTAWNRIRQKLGRATPSGFQRYLQEGRAFSRRVRADLQARPIDFGRTVFFSYSTGCYETLDFLQDTGCFTIVDQIDAGRVHREIVVEEAERWPAWSVDAPTICEPYEARLAAEWELADVVIVNSPWSKQALIQQHVPDEKIAVVPIAYEPPASSGRFSVSPMEGPLQVLWLGSVTLSKGIQYLMQAAQQLEGYSVEFTIVGPIGISSQAVNQAPPSVTFAGRVPRDQTPLLYRNADVFVLPTLSDGFAITQLEAMGHGLPVIATPNCGKVVSDGVDGFIVPVRDEGALAEAITTLADDRHRVEEMSRRTSKKVEQFSLENISEKLMGVTSKRLHTSKCA